MKKVLYAILAVLLIAGFCIGSAAAFTVDSSKVTVNPSGSLSPGDTVSAVITIDVPGKADASFSFTTPLEKASWHIELIMGGVTLTYLDLGGKAVSPSDFWTKTYEDPYSLKITMNGKVGNDLAGSKIRVATVMQSGGTASDLSTYSTPEQTVFDPDTVTKTISAKRAEIATIKEEAVFYNTFGIDVNATNDKIASAESYFKQAETYLASNNLNAANTAVSNGVSATDSANHGLAQLALDRIYSDITSIKGIIEKLLEKNWTNEATILTSKLNEITSSYNLLNTEYNNNGSPDCRTTLQEAENLNAQANEYLIKSESAPQFLQYWWVLLIVLGVAAVVVGVIFIIRRRGGGGWDELG